jgi:biopolymer transport protein ExbD
MNARAKATEEPAIDGSDMTPMIDVVFQLLIFFMLTMQFKEVEGKLLSQLPRHGVAAGPSAVREELRLFLRADGELCRASVEKNEVGELASTERKPDRSTANKAVYQAVAAKARGLIDALGDAKAAVILDAGPEVPYEHVLGVVDACKAVRIDAVEFTANPRLEKYYR